MKKHVKRPIPDNALIIAIEATMEDFPGYSVDKWGEKEASHCRDNLGDHYAHVETDYIRKRAINIRKSGRLASVNGGPKRKAMRAPEGKYKDYLQTEHWKHFRLTVLDFWEWRCCICSRTGHPEVHHNTYLRVAHEKLTDCVVLCRECHKRFHSALPDGNSIFNEDRNGQLPFGFDDQRRPSNGAC